jgi:hypothetical protein
MLKAFEEHHRDVHACRPGGGDAPAQPFEVARVEPGQVEPRLAIDGGAGPRARPRLRRHAEVHGSGCLRRIERGYEHLMSDRPAEKPTEQWVTGDEPMTGPQASYLETLAREAGEDVPDDLTKSQASQMIERLQAATGRGEAGKDSE